jgi:hypothetical protein
MGLTTDPWSTLRGEPAPEPARVHPLDNDGPDTNKTSSSETEGNVWDPDGLRDDLPVGAHQSAGDVRLPVIDLFLYLLITQYILLQGKENQATVQYIKR